MPAVGMTILELFSVHRNGTTMPAQKLLAEWPSGQYIFNINILYRIIKRKFILDQFGRI